MAFGEKANKKSENPFGEKASREKASSSSRRRLAAHGSSEKIVPQMSTIKEPKSEMEFRVSEKYFRWKEKVLERDREGMREKEEVEVEVEVARFMTSTEGKVQGNALRVEANVRRNAGVGVRSVHP